jgi:UDP-MurNAc hydroxylase
VDLLLGEEFRNEMKLKSSIEFINHASLLVSYEGVNILSDPWFSGDAFNKGWSLLHDTTDVEAEEVLARTSHIWISHEHPDHFSIKFFKTFKNQILQTR